MEPFPINVDKRAFLALPHDEDRIEYLVEHPEVDPRDVAIIMVTIFREKSFMDAVEVVEIDEIEDRYQTYIVLGKLSLVDWLAGFTLHKDRHKELLKTEEVAGNFGERFGWYPSLTVEDEPSESQEKLFMEWSLRDLNNAEGVPEEFFNE